MKLLHLPIAFVCLRNSPTVQERRKATIQGRQGEDKPHAGQRPNLPGSAHTHVSQLRTGKQRIDEGRTQLADAPNHPQVLL